MSVMTNLNPSSKLVDKLLQDVHCEQSPKFIKSSWGKITKQVLDNGLTLFKNPPAHQASQAPLNECTTSINNS